MLTIYLAKGVRDKDEQAPEEKAYIILVGLLHVVLLSIPFFSIPVVWTLTNVIHNLTMYVFLHTVKGASFETPDQGKAQLLTHWEQMDYRLQFTSSRKFLSISPFVLYVLVSFYTKYDCSLPRQHSLTAHRTAA